MSSSDITGLELSLQTVLVLVFFEIFSGLQLVVGGGGRGGGGGGGGGGSTQGRGEGVAVTICIDFEHLNCSFKVSNSVRRSLN